jgi:hypothetical protein
VRSAAGPREGPPACEQLVQQHTEGVDVAGHDNGFTTDLLGARVLRGQQPLAALSLFRGAWCGVEQLRDPEIEQPRVAGLGHEDVRGFDVAMDDQLSVGVSYGFAHAGEKLEPFPETQPVGITVAGDRKAFHVLHREVRQVVFGDATVEERSDARMAEPRQDLALLAEAPNHFGIQVQAAPDQLERDALFEDPVVAPGEVDGAHTPFADQTLDPIWTGPLRRRSVEDRLGCDQPGPQAGRWSIEDGWPLALLRMARTRQPGGIIRAFAAEQRLAF